MPPTDDFSNKELLERLSNLIKSTNEDTKQEIKGELKEINENLLERIHDQDRKLRELENKYETLKKNYNKLEKSSRKNNLIIFGLETDKIPENLTEFVVDLVKNRLQTEIHESEINNVYKIKTRRGTPVKIELVSYLKKVEILKKAGNLKGTGISLVHDLDFQERRDRQVLVYHMKQARSKKHYAKIVGNKLKVDGDYYTAEQLEPPTNIYCEVKSNSAPASPSVRNNVIQDPIPQSEPPVTDEQNKVNLHERAAHNIAQANKTDTSGSSGGDVGTQDRGRTNSQSSAGSGTSGSSRITRIKSQNKKK